MFRVALLIIVTCLACPSLSTAATYQWDPAAGSLRIATEAGDAGIAIATDRHTNSAYVCGGYPEDDCPRSVQGLRTLDLELSGRGQGINLELEPLQRPDNEVKTTITTSINNVLRLVCSDTYVKPQHACNIATTSNGIDVNGDGDTDITLNGPPLKQLLIVTGSGNDTIDLRAFKHLITVHPNAKGHYETDIDAGAGNDRILTGWARDTVNGGDGNDFIDLGVHNDGAGGGSGTNTIIGGAGYDVLVGSKLKKFPSNDTIYGGPGPDFIQTRYGNVRFYGGPGNDILSHGYGTAWMDLGPGNDYAEHFNGPYTGYGGPGSDNFRILTTFGAGLTAKINCGPGTDKTTVAYPHRTNCENVTFPNASPGK